MTNVRLEGKVKEIEREFTGIVEEMNDSPLKLDWEVWSKELGDVKALYEEAVKKLVSLTGNSKFRPNATADCEKWLKSQGADLTRKTTGGKTALGKEVLREHMGLKGVQEILEARGLLAVLSQVKKWGENYGGKEELQPKWNQFGTPMGRLSCENPALQNRVAAVRKCVVAHPGKVFVSMDLSQIEYRVWASLSKDPVLMEMFNAGVDFHEEMGKTVGGCLPEVTDKRKLGKMVNFALLYRMSEGVLASTLRIPVEKAREVMQLYRGRAKVAELYVGKVIALARDRGEVGTRFGRYREALGLREEENTKEWNEAVKTTWHHHNAGTAADFCKLVWNDTAKALEEEGLREKVRFVMNIHDSTVLEVDEEVADKVAAVCSRMANSKHGVEWLCEIRGDVTVGRSWGEVHS